MKFIGNQMNVAYVYLYLKGIVSSGFPGYKQRGCEKGQFDLVKTVPKLKPKRKIVILKETSTVATN